MVVGAGGRKKKKGGRTKKMYGPLIYLLSHKTRASDRVRTPSRRVIKYLWRIIKTSSTPSISRLIPQRIRELFKTGISK